MPDSTKVPPTVAVNLNQRNVALSRMNHPVVNSNPRPTNKMETRVSPRKGQSPQPPSVSNSPRILEEKASPISPTRMNDQNRRLQQLTSKVASVIESTDYVSSLHQQSSVAEHQQQVLIITSSANINIQPTISSNRKEVLSSHDQTTQQDIDGSSKYGDYLRGNAEYGENFSARAKTPIPEASSGKMLIQQQKKLAIAANQVQGAAVKTSVSHDTDKFSAVQDKNSSKQPQHQAGKKSMGHEPTYLNKKAI